MQIYIWEVVPCRAMRQNINPLKAVSRAQCIPLSGPLLSVTLQLLLVLRRAKVRSARLLLFIPKYTSNLMCFEVNFWQIG